jgi:effector-binding domain-containing protein
MKVTEPKLDDRSEQHYVGIRTQVTMEQMGSGLIPQLLDEVFGWLGDQGVAPAGPPLIRYYVINMEGNLDIELGVPVASALSGNGRIAPGVIPAGRYASLVYTGVENGIAGNGVLIGWAAANGIAWDRWDDANGDAFRSRVEYFLSGPEDDPDPANWDTEVAIKLAD